MSKSKEFVEGFKAALNRYSWIDNYKQLRVGIPGVLLTHAIIEIEKELEPEIENVVEEPVKEVTKENE